MNVKDVVAPPVPGDVEQIGLEIFSRQSNLESHYWKIENRGRQFYPINHREGQVLIKDFLWRFMEEVGEALEQDCKDPVPWEHVHEELADALHFLTGIAVITEMKAEFLNGFKLTLTNEALPRNYRFYSYHDDEVVNVVQGAGMLGNTLKMKPWKQTDVLTDEKVFREYYRKLVTTFLLCCDYRFDMDISRVYDFYYRKSEVNLFRIRSKY